MAIKLRIPRKKIMQRMRHPVVKGVLAFFLVFVVVCFGVFAHYYVKYQKIVDAKMRGQIFANGSKIYAAPETVRVGEKFDLKQAVAQLRRAGYTEEAEHNASNMGSYKLSGSSLQIQPGEESYHSADGAVIRVKEGKIETISQTGSNGGDLDSYELEPELVTGLFDQRERAKQRLITYDEMPKSLVDAIISIEDRRFFEHSGVNFYRLAEAVFIDLRGGHKQGGSTITMQIARGFFLNSDRNGWAGIKRKATEILIAMELEQRFSKKQILELYVNSVDMGQRGSFTIRGFGEGAQAYFGKDVRNLTLPESALLAGIVNGPSYFSPYRHPDRAMARRNLVIEAMLENGAITQEQAEQAKAAPLKLAPPNVEASDAPYFVDMVRDRLLSSYSESDLNDRGYRIYTTLDPDLQKAAAEAIEIGMKGVDELVQKKRTHKVKIGKGKEAKYETKVDQGPLPQVALVAIDPHTGDVVALSGGRNYAFSQLNHALAERPTGSIFKPFVYAAAMSTAINGEQQVYTPTSMVEDSPTVFQYGDQEYAPRNFEEKYYGPVSASFALAHSLNNATIKLAEEIGYDKVAALARAAGINSVKPTPAMAIGAYAATPMDMAGAYTVFANDGVRITPNMLKSLRDSKGDVVQDFTTDKKPVLDPRVSYVVTTMMEGVLNYGTAAGVRARGFSAPAAGKTGTSHDAWFAGYTSNLLCIVWVGNDDYTDIKIEGSKAAAPVWAEFMKRAIANPRYSNVKPFDPPPGVVDVKVDKATNLMATATCPNDYEVAFIAGTEPHDTCDHVAGDQRNLLQRIFGVGPKPPAGNPNVVPPPGQPPMGAPATSATTAQQQDQSKPEEKKKGFFGKIFGVFGGGSDKDKKKTDQPQSPPAQPKTRSSSSDQD